MGGHSNTIIQSFSGQRIVIAGDLVADQFLRGTISRVSREAPVFILKHDETETFAGGAANAAVNIASLGGNPVLIGMIGHDENGELLLNRLRESKVDCDHVVSSDEISTTTKIRVLAGQHYAQRQQVIRIDYENKKEVPSETRAKLLENFASTATDADAIILSDYGYGAADAALVQTARKLSAERKIPLLIDSRFRLRDFPNATSATPNQEEVEQILGKDFTPDDCSRLREQLGYEALLVTCGNQGMLLIEKDKPPLKINAVGSLEPVDVTGAGDTVIAVYALGLASSLSFAEAAHVANLAGSIVVMKKGTASVTPAELLELLASTPVFRISDTAS